LLGVYKALSTNGHLPIDGEKEISDDELENLALTFLSPEILSGMVDSNWKTRLSKVQEFSQVCVKVKCYFIVYSQLFMIVTDN